MKTKVCNSFKIVGELFAEPVIEINGTEDAAAAVGNHERCLEKKLHRRRYDRVKKL